MSQERSCKKMLSTSSNSRQVEKERERKRPVLAATSMCNEKDANQDKQRIKGSRLAAPSKLQIAGSELNLGSKLEANLQSAANEGKVELVRLLIRCGAEVNAQDEQFGNTALHQAAWNGFSETIQVLCKHRANTSIKNKALFTPLHMACQQGHNQSARLLLMAGAKTEAKNSYGDTPLHTAARYGHAGVARILLSANSNPNQMNKNHDTPLHIAAAMGRRKLTKIFMQNGAEPAIKNKQNETAMDIALRKDLIDIQELIANPPPARGAAARAAARRRVIQADQLPEESDLQAPVQRASSRQEQFYTKARRSRHTHQHQSSDEHSSDLNQRLARLTLRATASHAQLARTTNRDQRRTSGGGGRRGEQRRQTVEIAVDVPAGTQNKLVKQRSGFPSLYSLTKEAPSVDFGAEPKSSPFQAENVKPISQHWSARVSSHSSEGTAKRLTSRRSPNGSLRSSLSKSRGRLVARRRKQKSAPSLLVRRPNLGTCVGKLTLLRLRNMVQKRAERAAQQADQRGEPEQGVKAVATTTATGRRQEREERLKGVDQAQVAPNGTQLLATRPLAPLNDETQLYAIPKKSKAASTKQQVASNSNKELTKAKSSSLSEQQQAADRVPSGGPALTSDGGQSSSSNSSSLGESFARRDTPPTSSSPIASSSDECVDLICVNKRAERGRGIVVGVRMATENQYHGNAQGEIQGDQLPCLCEHADGEAYGQQPQPSGNSPDRKPVEGAIGEQLGAQQQMVCSEASKTGSKLRQLLHLNARDSTSKQPKPSGDTGDQLAQPVGGYFAYSPVVESSSNARVPLNKKDGEKQKVGGGKTKSWLKSKFSLSTSNVNGGASSEKPKDKLSDEAPNNQAPERRAELITISTSDLRSAEADNAESKLIRPSSVLSATSAELIAAQKSLAAAAAAKVKRDRLSKATAAAGGFLNGAEKDEEDIATSKESVLTVKTSGAPFWSTNHHHQPLVIANNHQGQKYMIGQPLINHRSGTNSVGMSDSSPSNNGAESDNSIQTTTGSANADTTNSEQAQVQTGTESQPSTSSGSSTLGILSRILLNNKNISNQLNVKSEQNGKSSPVNHNLADKTKLEPRSRCPIVLTKSNELTSTERTTDNGDYDDAVDKQAPPKLPSKGVLKTTSKLQNLISSTNGAQMPQSMIESMNGLPRVSSYGQMAANYSSQQHLCNFHAYNNLVAYNSGQAFAVSASAAAYPQRQQHDYDPLSANKFTISPNQLQHHLSQHDLSRCVESQSQLDLTLPAAAINYEYYLDSSKAQAGFFRSQVNQAARYHYSMTSNRRNDNSLSPASFPNYSHDDSIYIPYVNASQLIRDTPDQMGANNANAAGNPSNRNVASDFMRKQSYIRHHNQAAASINLHPRPKSSLDNFLISNNHHNHHNHHHNHHNQPTTNGRRLSATTYSQTNSLFPSPMREHFNGGYSRQKPLANYCDTQTNKRTNFNNYPYLYSENYIYAPDQIAASHFHQNSNLTVLPTTATPTPSNNNSMSDDLKNVSTINNRSDSSSYQQSKLATSSNTLQVKQAASINSSLSSPPSSSSSSNSPPIDSNTIQANQHQLPTPRSSLRQPVDSNSWTPATAPYKSLIQVNQSSSNTDKTSNFNFNSNKLSNDKHENLSPKMNILASNGTTSTETNNISKNKETCASKTRVLVNGVNKEVTNSLHPISSSTSTMPDDLSNGSTVL